MQGPNKGSTLIERRSKKLALYLIECRTTLLQKIQLRIGTTSDKAEIYNVVLNMFLSGLFQLQQVGVRVCFMLGLLILDFGAIICKF